MLTIEKPIVSPDARYGIIAAAKALRCAPSSIDRWSREGKLPYHFRAHSGQRFWMGADLLKFWMREQ